MRRPAAPREPSGDSRFGAKRWPHSTGRRRANRCEGNQHGATDSFFSKISATGLVLCLASSAMASDIGQVKVSKGDVVDRTRRPDDSEPPSERALQTSDVIKTGGDGSASASR